MKLLPRLLIALVVCLLVIPVLASPVQAAGITLSPTHGSVGEVVNVGGDFSSAEVDSSVYIYYEVATGEWELVDSLASIKLFSEGTQEFYELSDASFVVPPSCRGKHRIRVCHDKEDDASPYISNADFTVEPSLEIAKPSSEKGTAGTTVELKGYGWDEDESAIEVRFYLKDPGAAYYDDDDYYTVVASKDIDVDDYGTWKDVTFKVPPASKGKHWIYAVGNKTDSIGTDKINGVQFEILAGISLDSESGSFGKTITLTGSGFNTNETGIRILFGGTTVAENIAANDDGLWERTFTVPEVVKGEYDVTAEGSYTKKADIGKVKFEVVPGLVLNPTEGHVGITISVLGGGFPAGKTVTVTYDGVIKGTATTNTRGSFSGISFTATHTQSEHTAEHPVVATYDSTSVSGTNFIMESTAPPTPTLGSPIGGDRAGFIGWEFCPTFEWSGVTDDSGISHYSLRIASSEITAETTSFLFSRDIAVGDLTIDAEGNKVSYKLPKDSALPYGDYYWQVRAVDGAQNKGEWSTAQPFHAGLLPLWANIVIIVVIVVLIGVLVYFFKKRGRGYYD